MGANSDTIKIETNDVAFIQFHAKQLIADLDAIKDEYISLNIVGRANLNEWMGRITP